MYKSILCLSLIILMLMLGVTHAQTATAYKQQTSALGGLLDPAKFSMHQMVSFGMATAGSSSLKSQSLYTAMMQYKIAEPLTLRLDFSLPIHSTANVAHNLTPDNIQSAQYFQNMPFDASLTWKPANNLLMELRVIRNVQTVTNPFYPFISDYFIER